MNTRDTQESANLNRSKNRRNTSILLWLTVILLSLVVVGGTGVILYRPEVFGMGLTGDLTSTSVQLERTAIALDATLDLVDQVSERNSTLSVEVAGTGAAMVAAEFDLDSTHAALNNRETVVAQVETQSAVDTLSTATAVAQSNARQATQNALDFEATQSAFDRVATQVELDYQGTQAALNRDATAAVLGFSTQAPPAEDVLSQTPPPTITDEPLFTDGFVGGVGAGLWQFGSASDWALEDGILEAQRNGSWLLTQNVSFASYMLDVTLLPLQGDGLMADYYVLLNIPAANADDGMALRLTYNGRSLSAVGLYTASRETITQGVGLMDAPLTAFEAVQVNLPPSSELDVRVSVRGSRVLVFVNNVQVLDLTLDQAVTAGSVGIQTPIGTGVRSVTLSG